MCFFATLTKRTGRGDAKGRRIENEVVQRSHFHKQRISITLLHNFTHTFVTKFHEIGRYEIGGYVGSAEGEHARVIVVIELTKDGRATA